MKIICAWCQKDMGEVVPYEDESVTDGICEECRATIYGGKDE